MPDAARCIGAAWLLYRGTPDHHHDASADLLAGALRRTSWRRSGLPAAESPAVDRRVCDGGRPGLATGRGLLDGYSTPAQASGRCASSVREVTPVLVKMLCRWKSMVRGLRNRCAATSRVGRPPATRRATCTSWGVMCCVGEDRQGTRLNS